MRKPVKPAEGGGRFEESDRPERGSEQIPPPLGTGWSGGESGYIDGIMPGPLKNISPPVNPFNHARAVVSKVNQESIAISWMSTEPKAATPKQQHYPTATARPLR